MDLNEKLSPDKITLDVVKSYLRVDHDLDDTEIVLCYQSALSYVRKHIGATDEDTLDMDLMLPILSLTCHFYETKDVVQPNNVKLDEIFSSVLALNRLSVL